MTSGHDDKKWNERNSIIAFFAGRSILITGSTGFMGKVLVEKLLRSCPDITEIFLLMRPKRGLTIDERLKKLIETQLFDTIREQNLTSRLSKLIPVLGDASAEGLGLNEKDRQMLIDRVSVIYHMAANVRFHEDLKKDILSNVRSTREICILAKSIKNLAVLVHVSTAYSQCDKSEIEESLYPPVADWKNAIEVAENVDEDVLRILAAKYRDFMPNTYTFSKRIAENVIGDYSKDVPCTLIRPSIVTSTSDDPVCGWVDNFNGPMGMMVGGGKGILRVVYGNPHCCCDYLPVDIATRSILTATWKRGIATITDDPEVHVYNCAANQIRRINMLDLINLGLKSNLKAPLDDIIWYPWIMITNNRYLYYIAILFLHLLPALLLDTILKLAGKKPMLLDIHSKIYMGNMILNHFMFQEWKFQNKKMLSLLTEDVPPAETETFGYEIRTFDVSTYFFKALHGAKRYLLHEDVSKTEQIKRRLTKLKWLDIIVKALLIAFAAWLIWRSVIAT